jgi:hypothetical protein
MSLPEGFVQIELFPETQPEVEEKDETTSLSEEEVEIIEGLRWVVERIQSARMEDDEFDEYEYECLDDKLNLHKSWIIQRLRLDLGVPEHIAREWVLPLFNVPKPDEDYLLEEFNPPLYKKYMKEKEAFFDRLLNGGIL